MVRYDFGPSDTMKLADWARQNGVDYKTAYRWFRANTLPVSAWQHPQTGTILVEKPTTTDSGGVALYARVSSSDNARTSTARSRHLRSTRPISRCESLTP